MILVTDLHECHAQNLILIKRPIWFICGMKLALARVRDKGKKGPEKYDKCLLQERKERVTLAFCDFR